MRFYRVKIDGKIFRLTAYMQTIRNELFTEKEVEKYSKPDKHGYRMKLEWLEPVEVSRNKTHWLFGARFAD